VEPNFDETCVETTALCSSNKDHPEDISVDPRLKLNQQERAGGCNESIPSILELSPIIKTMMSSHPTFRMCEACSAVLMDTNTKFMYQESLKNKKFMISKLRKF